MNWTQAAEYCVNQKTGGLSGWRIPNIAELQSLEDYTVNSPYVNAAVFPNTPASVFWSSTTPGNSTGTYMVLRLNLYGFIYQALETAANQVHCARSCYPKPSVSASRYTIGSGIVTDSVTGLVWQKNGSVSTYSQSGALSYCTSLNLGGFSSGWRLPTVRELATLVDYSSQGSLVMYTPAFSGEAATGFWSSTAAVGMNSAWVVAFSNGEIVHNNIFGLNSVRCMR